VLGDPAVAVRAGSDPGEAAPGRDAGAVFGDDAGRRDLPDPVRALGKPEVAVRAGNDRLWAAACRDAGAVFGDDAGRRDLPDPVPVELGEPEVAVRARSDPLGAAASGDAGAVLAARWTRSTASRRQQQHRQRHRHQPANTRTHDTLLTSTKPNSRDEDVEGRRRMIAAAD